MKTKISFNLDSKDVIDQIGDLITADMKNEARSIADKAFHEALENKVEILVNCLDRELEQDYWRNSGLREAIKKAVYEGIDKYIQGEGVKDLIRHKVEIIGDEYQVRLQLFLDNINRKISDEVKKQVDEYMNSSLVKAFTVAVQEVAKNESHE